MTARQDRARRREIERRRVSSMVIFVADKAKNEVPTKQSTANKLC